MKLASKQFPNQTLTSSVGSASNSTGLKLMDDCYAIACLASGLTNTVTVQVEESDTGTNWTNLYSAGVLVNLQASGCIVIGPVPFRQIRFNSAATEGAVRTIRTIGQIVV